MRRRLLTAALALFALALIPATEARAQENGTPTRAGTQITSTATVTYTDANNNEYTASNSVTLTVAFKAGLEIEADGTVSPSSPSQNNQLEVTLTNLGNDEDSFELAATATAGIIVTAYKLGDVEYGTIDALNAILAATVLDYQGNAEGNPYQQVVTIVYDVVPNATGGSIEVTATSRSDGDAEDTVTVTVAPDLTYRITVVAQEETQERLPGGAGYTATFKVTSHESGSSIGFSAVFDNQDLFEVSSVTVNNAEQNESIAVVPGEEIEVVVHYTIDATAPAGANGKLTLTVSLEGASESAETTVTVIRPTISISKKAHLDENGAFGDELGANAEIEPASFIWYEITVTNTSDLAVKVVDVKDVLAGSLTFDRAESRLGTWTIAHENGVVTATLTSDDGMLAANASASFRIRVQVNFRDH